MSALLLLLLALACSDKDPASDDDDDDGGGGWDLGDDTGTGGVAKSGTSTGGAGSRQPNSQTTLGGGTPADPKAPTSTPKLASEVSTTRTVSARCRAPSSAAAAVPDIADDMWIDTTSS